MLDQREGTASNAHTVPEPIRRARPGLKTTTEATSGRSGHPNLCVRKVPIHYKSL
jgi:hypothetical protein